MKMTFKDENGEIFGLLDDNNNVTIFYAEDGSPVTMIDANIYPVDSELSTRYEHPEGITISRDDAEKLCIEIE